MIQDYQWNFHQCFWIHKEETIIDDCNLFMQCEPKKRIKYTLKNWTKHYYFLQYDYLINSNCKVSKYLIRLLLVGLMVAIVWYGSGMGVFMCEDLGCGEGFLCSL